VDLWVPLEKFNLDENVSGEISWKLKQMGNTPACRPISCKSWEPSLLIWIRSFERRH
jgi:hypothetical protein